MTQPVPEMFALRDLANILVVAGATRVDVTFTIRGTAVEVLLDSDATPSAEALSSGEGPPVSFGETTGFRPETVDIELGSEEGCYAVTLDMGEGTSTPRELEEAFRGGRLRVRGVLDAEPGLTERRARIALEGFALEHTGVRFSFNGEALFREQLEPESAHRPTKLWVLVGLAVVYVLVLGLVRSQITYGAVWSDFVPSLLGIISLMVVIPTALFLGHAPVFRSGRVPRYVAWLGVGIAAGVVQTVLLPEVPFISGTGVMMEIAIGLVVLAFTSRARVDGREALSHVSAVALSLVVSLVLIFAALGVLLSVSGLVELSDFGLGVLVGLCALVPAPMALWSATTERRAQGAVVQLAHTLSAWLLLFLCVVAPLVVRLFFRSGVDDMVGFIHIAIGVILGVILLTRSRRRNQSETPTVFVIIALAIIFDMTYDASGLVLSLALAGLVRVNFSGRQNLIAALASPEASSRPFMVTLEPLVRLAAVLLCVLFGMSLVRNARGFEASWLLGGVVAWLLRAGLMRFVLRHMEPETFRQLLPLVFAQGPISWFLAAYLLLGTPLGLEVWGIVLVMVVLDTLVGAYRLALGLRDLPTEPRPQPPESRTAAPTTATEVPQSSTATLRERSEAILAALRETRSSTGSAPSALLDAILDAETLQLSRDRVVHHATGIAQLLRDDVVEERVHASFRSSTRAHLTVSTTTSNAALLEALPWKQSEAGELIDAAAFAALTLDLLERRGDDALRLGDSHAPAPHFEVRSTPERLAAGLRALLS